jgi:thioredoxin-related protein
MSQTVPFFRAKSYIWRGENPVVSAMKKLLLLLLLVIHGVCFAADSEFPSVGSPYDPNRDAARDFERASLQAKSQQKKILLEVGGDWCSWCHILDKFLADNDSIREELLSTFVFLKVSVGPENQNQALLSRYPRLKGYPAFIITDSDGNLLEVENTSKLENRKSYSTAKFRKFIKKWQARANPEV